MATIQIECSDSITTKKPTLWHCHGSRSLRPLWLLEESGIDFDVVDMQFPPRINQPGYKDMNVLGTVPYFIDGTQRMSESTGICLYVVEKYQLDQYRISVDHEDYADYLNWLFMSDATLLFPQTITLRYGKFESEERKNPQVAQDYREWFWARLKRLDQHLSSGEREYLCGDRFTIADIAVTYALFLAQIEGNDSEFSPKIQKYLKSMTSRDAFVRAAQQGEALSPFLHPELWTMRK